MAQGPAAPLSDRDNKCYHECEAEEYGGNILQTDRHKSVMDGRVEEQEHSWSRRSRQHVLLDRLLLSGPVSLGADSANGSRQDGSSSISGCNDRV